MAGLDCCFYHWRRYADTLGLPEGGKNITERKQVQRILKGCLFIAVGAVALAVLLLIALFKFGHYMSEGDIFGPNGTSQVIVALTDSDETLNALRANCHAQTPDVNKLRRGELAVLPSGTAVEIPEWNGNSVEQMTVAAGPLKGRRIWVCQGEFALKHAWP